MTAPMNHGHYQRCFPNPWNRPSAMAPASWYDTATARRMAELNRWLDKQDGEAVVQGAEALLRSTGRRLDASGEGWQAGEPGA